MAELDPMLRWPLPIGYKSRSHINALIRAGRFPAPVRLGGKGGRGRAALWPQSVIEEWLDSVREGREWSAPPEVKA